MKTVYVTQRGATVRRDGNLLHVWVQRRRTDEIPVHDLRQLVLMGNIMISPAAIDLLVERGVDTVLLTLHGRYRARIVAGVSGNVRLRMAQYRLLSSEAGALELARRIVDGKASNQRAFLLRHARRHGPTDGIVRAERAIRATLARLSEQRDLDSVRGCEGAASAAYFRVFGDLLRVPGFRFDGRNRQPPLDPINALLSLGYTLLSNAVEAAVHIVGLDPYLGALHAPVAGRPSLVCDLVEEYRAAIVDPLVIAAVNRGAIEPTDFEDAGPGEPVIIKRDALRWFVTLFERRLLRSTLYEPQNIQLDWRGVIEQQARRFARHVSGTEPYDTYRVR